MVAEARYCSEMESPWIIFTLLLMLAGIHHVPALQQRGMTSPLKNWVDGTCFRSSRHETQTTGKTGLEIIGRTTLTSTSASVMDESGTETSELESDNTEAKLETDRYARFAGVGR